MAIKKIRVIGSDFTPVEDATISVDGGDPKKLYESDLSDVVELCISRFTTNKGGGITRNFGGKLYFGESVGVIRNKKFKVGNGEDEYDITLQLNCRFDKNNKAYFLAAMLLSEDDIENKFKNERVEISYDDIFEVLLLYLFQTQLKTASAKGIYRRYVRFENNDSRPHGVIDISRHIKENVIISGGKMRNNGKIAYSYRELTANNSMNRLILAAYEKLRSRFPSLTEKHIGSRHESFIKTLQAEIGFSNTSPRSIVSQNLNPITHPYYHEYEELRKTCLKILRDDGVSIFDAECSDDVESLLLDVTKLWEHYLENSFKAFPMEFGFDKQVKRSYCSNILKKTAEPDLVFYRDKTLKTPIAILDAKFKPFWSKALYQEETDDRISDDLDKCIRDMTVFDTRRTGVIFPCEEETYTARKNKKRVLVNVDVICRIGDKIRYFDMAAVTVPSVGEQQSFSDWHEILKKHTEDTLKIYVNACLDVKRKGKEIKTAAP